MPPRGAVLQRRLPTVKQSGQLGCHVACAVWQASHRHDGSGSAVAALTQCIALRQTTGLCVAALGLLDLGQQQP